jgi:hypothetical protein
VSEYFANIKATPNPFHIKTITSLTTSKGVSQFPETEIRKFLQQRAFLCIL